MIINKNSSLTRSNSEQAVDRRLTRKRELSNGPLRAVVIGCGAVAQRLYAKPLRELERRGLLAVKGLVDPNPAGAKALQKTLKRSDTYTNATQALEAADANVALILSPAHLHDEQAIMALQSGVHVLCEKPMAKTTVACSRMNEAAYDNDLVLGVGMVRRFFPACHELKNVVDSGLLGTIQSIHYQEGQRFDWDVKSAAGFGTRRNGGAGVLFDIGPHAFDLLIWIFGCPTITHSWDDALGGVESNVVVEAVFGNTPGRVQLSWDTPLANELRVVGTRAEVVLRLGEFDKLAIRRTGGVFEEINIETRFAADMLSQPKRTRQPRIYTQAIYCQLIQFLRAIQHGERPAVDGEMAEECVSVLETIGRLAVPIEMNWLARDLRESFERLHWRNQ